MEPPPPGSGLRNTDSTGLERITAAQVVDLSPVPTFVIDLDHRITHWNQACEQLTGYPAKEIVGTRNQWRPFYPSERLVMADILLDGGGEAAVRALYEGKYRRSKIVDGAFEGEDFFPHFGTKGRWLYFTAALLRDEQGRITGAIETLQDISARRRAEIALEREKSLLADIINGSVVASIVLDSSHTIVHMNHAYEALFGVSAKEMVGTQRQWHPAYTSPRPILADLLLNKADHDEVAQYYGRNFHDSPLIPGAIEAEAYFTNLGANGKWLYLTAAPLSDNEGHLVGAIETLLDITERKTAEIALQKSEERYRQLSITDGLTGLGNLRSCYDNLEKEISRSRRYQSPLSCLMFDVDNFKHFNDTWGHMEGDTALKTMAACITRNLRKTDSAYRYGGEEFVILLPGTSLEQASILAERIRVDYANTRLSPAKDVAICCTVSIGAAELSAEDTAKDFLQRADQGTYQAKANGKNQVVSVTAAPPTP